MICYSRRSAQVKLLIPESFISFDLCHLRGVKVSILYESLLRGFTLISGTFRFSFGHSADLICIMYKSRQGPVFRQGVRRILKTPPAESTSAIHKGLLRWCYVVLSVIIISEQDINSFIKAFAIIRVNIKHLNTP